MTLERHYIEDDPREEAILRGRRIAVVVVILAGVVLFASLFSKAANVGGFRRSTIENYKSVALAAVLYMSDNDDLFPPEFETNEHLRTYLDPYTDALRAFETHNPNGGEMEGNPRLGGLSATQMEDSESAVMLYDTRGWDRDGGRVVAHADGHVQYVHEFHTETDLDAGLGQSVLNDLQATPASP